MKHDMELEELKSARRMLKEALEYQETYSERVEIRKDIREIETIIKEVEQQNATTQAFDYSSRSE
jgi:hypothetical protein